MAEDRENTNRRERKPSLVIVAMLLLIIFGAFTGVLSLALGKGSLGFAVFKSYFQNNWLLLFNLAPVVVLHIAVYMLVGRPWLAFLLSSGGVLFFSFLEGLKIKQVSDVIWFSDIVSGEAFDYISDGSAVKLDLLSIGCVIYLIAVTTLLLVMFLKRKSPWFAGRIIFFAILVAGSIWGYKEITNTDKYGGLTRNDECVDVNYEYQRYISKGFVYPLMLSAADKGNAGAPGGYDEKTAEVLLNAYRQDDIPEERAISLVVIQLGSFADLSAYTCEDADIEDAYKEFNRIKNESYYGRLVVPLEDVGRDPEWGVLTGFMHVGTVRTRTNSCVYYLRSQYYKTKAVFFGSPDLYSRERISGLLGFEETVFLDAQSVSVSQGGTGGTDWMLYSRVYDLWREGIDAGDGRQFIFAHSTQNERFSRKGSGDAAALLNDYLSGIKDSMYYLGNMLDRMEQQNEPVAVLIYSADCPQLGSAGDSLTPVNIQGLSYSERNKDAYMDTAYMIWLNSAAKAAVGSWPPREGKTISGNYLISELFSDLYLGGSQFIKACEGMSVVIPAVLDNGLYLLPGRTSVEKELDLGSQTVLYNHEHLEYYEKTHFRFER